MPRRTPEAARIDDVADADDNAGVDTDAAAAAASAPRGDIDAGRLLLAFRIGDAFTKW